MGEDLGVRVGQTVAGRYRLVKLLGRGGMGSVWLADHLTLQSPVAIKIIKPTIAQNELSVARFLREAKAAAMLRSPHVVQILDHGSDGDVAFITMELLEGETLFQRLTRERTLSPGFTLAVMTHIGRAMARAHEAGIVHRDLKPDNVFLVTNDDEILAKVLDFGIAKSSLLPLHTTGDGPQTQTGTLLGTPYYMSPEQATGDKNIDHRSDLWAMGVITYECLVGRRPFQSDSLGELVLQICTKTPPVPSRQAAVPAGFDAWFARSIEREPADRFQNAKDLVAALRQVLGAAAAAERSAAGRRRGDAFASDVDVDEVSAARGTGAAPARAHAPPSAGDSASRSGTGTVGAPPNAHDAGAGVALPWQAQAHALAPTVAGSPLSAASVAARSESGPRSGDGARAAQSERPAPSTLDSIGVGLGTAESIASPPRRSRVPLFVGIGAALAAGALVFALTRSSSTLAPDEGSASGVGAPRGAGTERHEAGAIPSNGDSAAPIGTSSSPSSASASTSASAGASAASASASSSASAASASASSGASRPPTAGATPTRPPATTPTTRGTGTDPLGI